MTRGMGHTFTFCPSHSLSQTSPRSVEGESLGSVPVPGGQTHSPPSHLRGGGRSSGGWGHGLQPLHSFIRAWALPKHPLGKDGHSGAHGLGWKPSSNTLCCVSLGPGLNLSGPQSTFLSNGIGTVPTS